MKVAIREIYRFFSSVRLAVVLIAYLAVTAVFATLVPQGMPRSAYEMAYPPVVAWVVTVIGLDRYFTSVAFLVPAAAFLVNLCACAVGRFVRVMRSGTISRHDADILHLGLILLFVGAIVSFSGRREGRYVMLPGDALGMFGGTHVTLIDASIAEYPDGRPRDYVAIVDVSKGPSDTEPERRELRVNAPIRIMGLSMYLYSLDRDAVGHGEPRKSATLLVTYDPGYIFVLTGLCAVTLGTVLTTIRKLKEANV